MRDALGTLRSRIESVRLPFATPEVEAAKKVRSEILAQLDDYILPRLAEVEAPLLMVVGGSTGAGKSTLVNSIIRKEVSMPGVLRPTTRSPVLVHHPDDVRWFDDRRVLPDLARSSGSGTGGLKLVADAAMPVGLAMLDAPDIDSVVHENRQLAQQLLAAADLWMFVTTAARYADAVPWEFLTEAADRSAAVSVVLDRVPPEAVDEIRIDLASMLSHHGLGDAPLFVVPEVELENGLLPLDVVTPIGAWLHSLAGDERARARVVARTLEGAISGLIRRAPIVAEAADEQAYASERLAAMVVEAYGSARKRIDDATGDGTLLRGEVLARWQDFVGTGEFVRSLEARLSRIRDRVGAFFRGRSAPEEQVEAAIESSVQSLVLEEAARAADDADSAWRHDPAGRAMLGSDDLSRPTDDLPERAAAAIRAWQGAVLELVRAEGSDKRATARRLSFGVNGLGVALMVVVFASTAGLTGLELGVAGGTAVVGQKVLEAVFGDQAVRKLAERARDDLGNRLSELFNAESRRFTDRLDAASVDSEAGQGVRTAAADVLLVKQMHEPVDPYETYSDDPHVGAVYGDEVTDDSFEAVDTPAVDAGATAGATPADEPPADETPVDEPPADEPPVDGSVDESVAPTADDTDDVVTGTDDGASDVDEATGDEATGDEVTGDEEATHEATGANAGDEEAAGDETGADDPDSPSEAGT